MEIHRDFKKILEVAAGRRKAALVLKGGFIVNVYTEKILEADIAIEDGSIAGIGEYEGEAEVDMKGRYICPGFIDGHIHLESSMVSPPEFEKAVLPHGTTAVVTDPHEIGNVAGTQGIDYMMAATKDLDLDVFFMLPSCVPSTELDQSGAVLRASDLRPYYDNPRVLGLAEVMNSYGVIAADRELLAKIKDARERGLAIDGHAPFLEGKGLCAYLCAGVGSDHECSQIREALEKLAMGQWIMIREGTAAQNMEALMPLFEHPYCERSMLVTDDKHPGDLIAMGHIDYMIKKAVSLGADPLKAIKMGTISCARCFGLKDRGAVAPGMRADLAVLEDLKEMKVLEVYKDGRLVAKDGLYLGGRPTHEERLKTKYPRVFHSFHMNEVREEDIRLTQKGPTQRVIQLKPRQLLTEERLVPWKDVPGFAPGVDIGEDIVKAAVFERHLGTGHIGLGFVGGYGLRKGAVATSVAHDSHNLITVGVNDGDMVLAANRVRANGGGLAVAVDGSVIGELALPIGGIMTDASVSQVEEGLKALKDSLGELGIREDIDAFMTLAFVSLPVIPKLRINTYGIIDVETQKVVSPSF